MQRCGSNTETEQTEQVRATVVDDHPETRVTPLRRRIDYYFADKFGAPWLAAAEEFKKAASGFGC